VLISIDVRTRQFSISVIKNLNCAHLGFGKMKVALVE